MLATVVEFWLGKAGVAVPSWVNDSSRISGRTETPHLGQYDLPPDLTNVPDEFLRRNILIERSTLASPVLLPMLHISTSRAELVECGRLGSWLCQGWTVGQGKPPKIVRLGGRAERPPTSPVRPGTDPAPPGCRVLP